MGPSTGENALLGAGINGYNRAMQRRKPEQDHTSEHAGAHLEPFTCAPIGVVRSPYTERFGTPRQPSDTLRTASTWPKCLRSPLMIPPGGLR